MEPIQSVAANADPSDVRPWSDRHVQWGLRMLRPDISGALASFSPGECREVQDFLSLHTPSSSTQAKRLHLLAGQVSERLRVPRVPVRDASVLDRNVRLLQHALGLNDVESDIVAFRAMLRLHPGFEALAGKYIGLCADCVLCRKLAVLFDAPMDAISHALARTGKLTTSGLVTFRAGELRPLETRIHFVQGLIGPLGTTEATSAAGLLASVLPSKCEAHLSLNAYPHLTREIRLLKALLGDACTNASLGVNVLLYGAPGTGKTELAGALAAALLRTLYPLTARSDGRSYSYTPRDRFSDLASLQKLVHVAGRGIVLVDEAADLFPTAWSDLEKVPTKATINECLETNPTPTIWISNRIGHMDEAFLRRFDLVVKVPPLPSRLRRNLLRDALPPRTLPESELRYFGERRELTPAVLARMARVAMAGDKDEPMAIRANLQILASQYLRSLGTRPLARGDETSMLEHDPELLNTDPPMPPLLDTISHHGLAARLLLHGVPGTGKTALGKALAERLDKPLLQRQASSLLSCWVGETERNLRDMFDEARQENGILLLDEADSFLSTRDRAHARWEVTQTNELLTQIENFEGILICTTNRLVDLDPAVLRRFDFKVAFRPLRPCQRVRLVRQCCAKLGIDVEISDAALAERVRTLDGCTPGDAAAVLRRLAVTGIGSTLEALLLALVEECRYKPAVHPPIGFVY